MFLGGNWYVANTILNSSPFSQIEFINSDSAFTGASIATDSARLTVDETSLSISYSNIFFNESETSWTSSSISLNGSFVRMQSDSTWTSFRSSLQLESAEVYLAKGSALEFYFCVIESNQAGLSINIGENATMTIATFSDYLFCNLKSNITVPENAIYTEANITDALECSSQKIEKTAKKIRKKSDQIVSRQTMLGSTIHMDSCPKKSFSTSTRKPIATSSTSHLIPETTKTSSKLTSGAGTKTYFIWILIFHILLIRQLA